MWRTPLKQDTTYASNFQTLTTITLKLNKLHELPMTVDLSLNSSQSLQKHTPRTV